MIRVRIDLPLFHSPTEAFGTLSGEIDLDTLPCAGDVFPWPQDWIDNGPRYLSDPNQSRVWGVHPWELTLAKHLVTLFGFVCESVADARNCAAFFQTAGGLSLDEY
jgi:hypothetical protein